MDYLRSCYRCRKAIYRDRPDVYVEGRWRWCRPGAKSLPFTHGFGSYNWKPKQDKVPPDPFPELPSEQYSRGAPLGRLPGTHFCGTEEDWREGGLYAERGTMPVDGNGVPLCCKADEVIPGGLSADGAAAWIHGTGFLGTGGVLVDGFAGWPSPGRGGVLVDGFAGWPSPGRGGVLVDGTAGYPSPGRGGVLVDGTAGYPSPGRGGVLVDGSGPAGAGVLAGRGGVLVDGSGPAGAGVLAGRGGVLVDGSGPQGTASVLASTGGVLVDGFAGWPSPGIGGVLTGGDAATQGSIAIPTGYDLWEFDRREVSGALGAGISWVATSINSGSQSQVVGPAGTYGVSQLSTGAVSALGGTGMVASLNVSGPPIDPTVNTSYTFEFRIYLEQLSVLANRYTVRVGMLDLATAAPTEGAYFRYADNVNSGKWEIVTTKTGGGAGETAADSGVAPAANTITTLKVVFTPSLASFFIDGNAVGTIATNLTVTATSFGGSILKSLGTASRHLNFDRASLLIVY